MADLTELRDDSEQLRRLRHVNRLYAVLTAVNRAVTRRPGRQELLQDICRILVEVGDFRMVWFGVPDGEGWIIPEAVFGDNGGYLAGIRTSVLDIPEGRGPSGTAIRENRPVICNDIPTNLTMRPWQAQAARCGYNALASFPVRLPSGGVACLTLYSSEYDFFSTDEEILVTEICADVGYSLEFAATAERLDNEHTILKTLLDAIPDQISLKDPEGAYLFCNPAFERAFGTTERELLGRTDEDLFDAEQAASFREGDLRAAAAGQPARFDQWVTYPGSGHRALLETIKAPLFDNSGRLTGVLGIARNVTKTRLAQQELEQQHKALTRTQAIARLGGWTADLATGMCINSPEASAINGLPTHPVHWESFFDLVAPEEVLRLWQVWQEALKTGKPYDVEHRITVDGQVKWVHDMAELECDDAGRPVRITGIIQDITERKRAEQELSNSELKFRAFTEVAQNAVIQMDEEGLVIYWNHAAVRIFGYSPEEILGHPLHEILAPSRHGDAYRASRGSYLATGDGGHINRTVELSALRKNGEEFPIEISLSTYQIDGHRHALGIVRDITERKRAEEALQKQTILLCQEVAERHQSLELLKESQVQLEMLNRELEARVAAEVQQNRTKDQALMQSEKMAALGQLAAGVAHEINNPMGFITSNLRVLSRYLDNFVRFDRTLMETGHAAPPAWETIRQCRESLDIEQLLADSIDLLDESLTGAERVTKIVEDLKKFSRVDALEREPVLISSCLDSALNLCHNELKYKAAILKEYEPVPAILCHPGELNQVFLNLLVNAGQAIDARGEITLQCRCDDAFVYASISDSGTGIPEEVRDRMYDPFFTTREVGQGTGLGLSIAQRIIKKHQGEILVASAVGKGTTFTVKLPRIQEELT